MKLPERVRGAFMHLATPLDGVDQIRIYSVRASLGVGDEIVWFSLGPGGVVLGNGDQLIVSKQVDGVMLSYTHTALSVDEAPGCPVRRGRQLDVQWGES